MRWLHRIFLKGNRFGVECRLVIGTIYDKPKVKTVKFVVDTGALYTCCYYRALDNSLRESSFENKEYVDLGGFVDGSFVRFYKYHVASLTLGDSVHLLNQDIWITFDNRITDYTLGMDLLKEIAFLFHPESGQLMIFNTYDELSAYVYSGRNSE